jgi:hypothetical protein
LKLSFPIDFVLKGQTVTVKHLNQTELAERWGLATATLERWRCEGIGPVFIKLHGRVIYRLADIEEYEAKCLRSSTATRVAQPVALDAQGVPA